MGKEKGSIALLLIFVLLLAAAGGFFYFRSYFTKQLTQQTPKPMASTVENKSVSYKGKVLKVVEEKEKYRYQVTLQPQDSKGNNSGKAINFTVPKMPLLDKNGAVLGSNFKEVIDKGLNPVDIAITYDENGRFLSWRSLKTAK